MAPTSIDGTDISSATIDGQEVQEITVDGDVVFTAGPDIPEDYTAYYKFDGNSTDETGNNNGTNNGAGFTSSPAIDGQSINFDGFNDYFETNYAPTDTQTWSIWINPDEGIDDSGITRYMGFLDDPFDNVFNIVRNGNSPFGGSGGAIYLNVDYGGVDNDLLITESYPTNWMHIVVMYDENAPLLEAYLNGTKVNSSTSFGSLVKQNRLFIGNIYDGGNNGPRSDNYFDGQVDEAKIYERVLTEEEVQALYDEFR